MYLQPTATIMAALVAVLVTGYFGWHQRKIAKRQAEIASEKLRLDLYNRRFEVFSSIFDFYEAMISWDGRPEHLKARSKFFRAYQESAFLFAKESGIEQLLKSLNDSGAKVIGFKENSGSLKVDPRFYIEKFNEMNDIQITVFDVGLAKFREAIYPYLHFSKID